MPDEPADNFAGLDADFVAVLYDDDALLPNWLPAHLAVMAEGCDVVAGSYVEVDAALRPHGTRVLRPLTLRRLRRGHVDANDGSLIRRSALVPMRPERGQMMFFTLWGDMARAGARFGVVEEPTWLYRRHEGQASAHLTARDDALRAETIAELVA
jgi:hypothetical protein